ncbi:MAG TPA: phosphoribosylglycinamide synthetase C domain-containing protein [Verrucomicrobiae bacterium]|nr:phosphoribosylglycinamide synthetase C domain-containing protein [Verrucomicrobiae bacterium]
MSKKTAPKPPLSVMALGVGSFAHGTLSILREAGANVSAYLTRTYAHFPPSLVGPVYSRENHPSPVPLLRELGVDFLVPMSIDWAQAPWADDLLASGVPILSPTGEGMLIERERDFARRLCREHKVSFPTTHVASNRLEAEAFVSKQSRPFVIKNPLCSPGSPIHTIVCETVEDTRSWLRLIDYAEGVFLQEYLGPCEAGHIVFISGGEIHSLVTNQEYKKAFAGNMGVVAGAPLGGLVEKDPEDKYGLARELIHPLLPWFKSVKYHGPLQVTAIQQKGRWHAVEYNIRLGVTSGNMILRLLRDPLQTLHRVTRNQKLDVAFRDGLAFGCSVTVAGYGYPYTEVNGPPVPLDVTGEFDCDVWWNEVTKDAEGRLLATGHRVADVIALSDSLDKAIQHAYRNVRKIRCLASYYRNDIGQSLWPPGNP